MADYLYQTMKYEDFIVKAKDNGWVLTPEDEKTMHDLWSAVWTETGVTESEKIDDFLRTVAGQDGWHKGYRDRMIKGVRRIVDDAYKKFEDPEHRKGMNGDLYLAHLRDASKNFFANRTQEDLDKAYKDRFNKERPLSVEEQKTAEANRIFESKVKREREEQERQKNRPKEMQAEIAKREEEKRLREEKWERERKERDAYNKQVHKETFAGESLFSPDGAKAKDVTIIAIPRSSTWTKVFDLEHTGTSEHDYQAYTYDFTVSNNTKDQVNSFSFTMKFSKDVFLASAWNGALEIHNIKNGSELVTTVPDLREFKPEDYNLDTITIDGESFVSMKAGDYIKYIPSSSMNAMEIPIEPMEGTTPGIIMYVAIGENLNESTIDLEYTYNRQILREPLFRFSLICLFVWVIALIIFIITSIQISQYQRLHERDNKIINESIETFTGFIDAKDPYTNGHSKRVALLTRMLAAEFGYDEDELNRIYYVALLHDCGKIGVPDNILGKPGRLTDEEFEIIKSHTVRGGEILSSFKSLENAGEGALYHHERFDGKGYPEGRAGEDIPFIARMICVADSFDAMNTDRCYRPALSMEQIVSELEKNRGLQFDAKVADVMLRLIREGKVNIDI